jgi:hypothetical protein
MMDDFEIMSPRESQHSTLDLSDQEAGGSSTAHFRWTAVTADMAVLDHLFQLYFSWIHPVHTLFSEGHFVDSYKRQSKSFCSALLVNSICAMACHLHSGSDNEEVDFDRLGIEFSDAVRASIDADDKDITTVQSFAVMFLVDCARANGLRASSYLRVASNNLSSVAFQENDGFREVWKYTVRGVRNLCVEWAQVTFQVPPRIDAAPYDTVEEHDGKLDEANWYFYRYVNDQCPAWPGLLATTNREKSKLIAIIQDVITMMYAQQVVTISAQEVLYQYSRFVEWREALPSSIGNIEDNNSQALPHVLSLL